jgi:molybdenum cofactor cytidylyltransferase
MGKEKLLLPLGDRPVIAHSIGALREAGVSEIVAVTRPEGTALRDHIRQYQVTSVVNPDPASDMAGSVRSGLPFITGDTVFVFPADYPLISPATLRAMLAAPDSAIVIPRCHGRRGHPVLFPYPLLKEINTVPTLRDIISRHQDNVRYVDVPDTGILLDMDTPEDYLRMCALFHIAD